MNDRYGKTLNTLVFVAAACAICAFGAAVPPQGPGMPSRGSYVQANPHHDTNVVRTVFPEMRVPLEGTAAIRSGEWHSFALEVVGSGTPALDSLFDEVERWVEAGDVVGAEMLVVAEGDILLHEVVGWSDLERAIPLRPDAIYELSSMTKPVVATAILMLAEEGRLSLDDRVAAHLPSFTGPASREVTVRQLLTHTAGYEFQGFPGPRRGYGSLKEAVDAVGRAGPQHPPGDQYRYSDVSTSVLGGLIAEVSGVPLAVFLERRIFRPLGMDDTHVRFSPDAPWASRVPAAYQWDLEEERFRKTWDPTRPPSLSYFRASGGLYSTAADYSRFMRLWTVGGAVDGVRLLGREWVEEALRVRAGGMYGFHWFIRPGPRPGAMPACFWHDGAAGTLAVGFPALDAVVVYLTQSRRRDHVMEVLRLLFDLPAPALRHRSSPGAVC